MMPTLFAVAFALCGLLNAGLALLVLLGRRPAPIDAGRVATAATLVALATGVELVALVPLGLHPFGLVHLGWIQLAYVVPLAGAAVLFAGARGRRVTVPARLVAWTSLLALPVAGVAHIVEPYRLVLEQATVPLAAERARAGPLRIGVLADLQTPSVGPHERAAVARLMACVPDLILVPGDLYQGPSTALDAELADFHELLGQLSAPGGVWVVPGNSDNIDDLPRLLAGTGARLLRDEVVRFSVGERRVALLGLDERVSEPLPASLLRRFAERGPDDEGELRLVLAHRPRAVLGLPARSGVDLVVAGHTHGGQVVIPGLGPPLDLSPLPNRIGAGGLHAVLGNPLYISRGVGMERGQAPRIRLFCPPEVSLLTLTDAPPSSGAPPSRAAPSTAAGTSPTPGRRPGPQR